MVPHEEDEFGTWPMLATKLDPPAPVPGLMPRPELVNRLVAATGPLTLIDAPAGWGKSSLISEWFEHEAEDRAFAFLRLSAEDDDPRSFWAYTSAAIGRVVTGWAPPIRDALRAPDMDPTRSLVPNIINTLHQQDQRLVVVLDDYQIITDPEVHGSVAYLIDNAPQCLHLVISTRLDPPLPLARHRAAGSVTEIRVNDLRLSSHGTQGLLHERFGIEISDRDAEILCERTEGWPAGIQLAGVSMAADTITAPSEFVADFAGNDRNIADYLTTEVLRRQPERRREFLLATSFLDEFNADLCNHLFEITDSASMLTEIEEHNLFLISLDSRREWFRYHHLFGDWLRHLHQSTAAPEAIVRLRRRASDWLQENGFIERALGHLVAAGDLDQAAGLMDSIAARESMMAHITLRQWIHSIPDELTEDRPALALARVSWLLLTGDAEGARRVLEVAERAIGALEDGGQKDLLTTTATMSHGIRALRAGDMEVATHVFESVLDDHPPSMSNTGIAAQGLLGVARFWTSGAEAALPHMLESAEHRLRASMPDLVFPSYLAAAYAELGRWDEAEAAAAAAFSIPTIEGSVFPFKMAAHYAMAAILQHRGQTGEAIEHAEQGLEDARAWVQPYLVGWGCVVMAELIDDPVSRRQLLAEARQQTVANGSVHRLLSRIEAAERPTNRQSQSRVLGTGMILDPLTARELEVLRLLRGDLTVREIGNELFISYNTAKGYTKTIYQKLGVSSRAEAVTAATAASLI